MLYSAVRVNIDDEHCNGYKTMKKRKRAMMKKFFIMAKRRITRYQLCKRLRSVGSWLIVAEAKRRNVTAERLHRRPIDERSDSTDWCGTGGDQERHEVLVRAERATHVRRELRVASELLEIRLAAHLKMPMRI